MQTPRPINAAEAIISPFWDPRLDEIAQWEVLPGEAHGLSVTQNWCWLNFSWVRAPLDGPALTMRREYHVDCSGYDHLVVSAVIPQTARLLVLASTDSGEHSYQSPPSGVVKEEHCIPLRGASRLRSVTLEIYEGTSGIRHGWFNWIGLQNAHILPYYLKRWSSYDERWEGYLKPLEYEPGFEPELGIVATSDELEEIRSQHETYLRDHDSSPYTEMRDEMKESRPEEHIAEYVSFFSPTRMTNDTRYNRVRDHEKALVISGQKAAIAGVVFRDPKLLRLAARYAMSIAMCTHWDDGMVTRLPGGMFDHRAFVQSLCLHDVAMIFDLAGELFTDLGREYLLRRLSREGLASVTYNTWKHEYIFSCNQLAWFTPGRMLASLVVERTWPRAAKYTDIAYEDLNESMELSILPDGGYVEGPNYFQCVGRDACLSYYYYARARGLDFASIVPEIVKRTAGFGAAVISTDEGQDVVPICDAKSGFSRQATAFLAVLMPGSAWSGLFAKEQSTSPFPSSLPEAQLAPAPAPGYRPPPLVVLGDMGLVASHRRIDGSDVKLVVLGNRAGAGHTHEDKGSFVLEFAGETYAMDPGTCDYSDPLAEVLKHAERHNMLVPTGIAEEPRPVNPLDRDIKPDATGDGTRFDATLDLLPGWEEYFSLRRRTFTSPDPALLIVEDEYELVRGTGVAFVWNTTLDVQMEGGTARISGRNGCVTLKTGDECRMLLTELPLPGGKIQKCIRIEREGSTGALRVEARIEPSRITGSDSPPEGC